MCTEHASKNKNGFTEMIWTKTPEWWSTKSKHRKVTWNYPIIKSKKLPTSKVSGAGFFKNQCVIIFVFRFIRGTNQSIPAAFTSMGTTPKDCVASTTKQLRFPFGLNSSNTSPVGEDNRWADMLFVYTSQRCLARKSEPSIVSCIDGEQMYLFFACIVFKETDRV